MAISDTPPNPLSSTLFVRAKAILTRPATEWLVIDQETTSISTLFKGYILPLAAIPPACRFLHGVLFGYGAFGFSYRPSFFGSLISAIGSYVLSIVMLVILALLIEALAPTFLGQKNRLQALKLVAYSATASWLAGIFDLIPGLGLLSLLGLYSFYLFWTGLPVLMKSPPQKTLPYIAVIVLAAIVLSVLISPLTIAIFGGTSAVPPIGQTTGSVTTPDGSSFNLDKLQQAATAMEETAKRVQSGEHPTGVAPDGLKLLMPASLPGGFKRHDFSSTSGEVGGFGGSHVEANYTSDAKTITLSITDLGAAGGFVAAASALGIKTTQEDGDSISKIDQLDGRTEMENYDNKAQKGDYSLVVASRFVVKAEGSDVSREALKGAVGTVNLAKLETLAK
jgi:hypothetical protein